MRTLIVDCYLPNSPQIEHLYKVVSEATVHTVEIKDYSVLPVEEGLKFYDCVVLSGSQRKLAEPGVFDLYQNVVELIKNTTKPVLGICFGHQLLGRAFYEEVVPMGQKLDGYYMVRKIAQDELLQNLPERFLALESHEEMLEKLPSDFVHLADSPNCPIEVMKHQMYPLYGVQFHPERFDDKHPAGRIVLNNFFKIVSWYM